MKTYTATQLAELIHGTVKGNPDKTITGINSLKLATSDEASFLSNHKYRSLMESTKAGIVLVPSEYQHDPLDGQTLIICENPDKAFSKLCQVFAPDPVVYEKTIHPTAFVHPTAHIGTGVHVGPTAVIDEGAVVEDGATICAGAYVGQFCHIGENTFLYPNVTIMKRCLIGKRCILHGGVVIGGDGFGYNPTFKGLVKVPQNGIVQIDDDVEIGANSTVDRARFGKTWIKKGVKIDNLCHVAHNVVVGQSSVLIGQSGIAGSTEIGRGVVISAQAGINGHITIGDGAKVCGASAVQKSVAPGETVLGVPAEPLNDFVDRLTLPRKLKRLTAKIAALEAELKEIREKLK